MKYGSIAERDRAEKGGLLRTVMSTTTCLLLSSFAAGCGCHADDPCLRWASVGTTYSVELATRLDPMLVRAAGSNPFAGWVNYPSCGAMFDLTDAQQVKFTATGRRDSNDECADCYWLWGRVEGISNGTLATTSPAMMGQPLFEATHQATIGMSCSGKWIFGVSSFLGGFSDAYSGPGKTAVAAYRFFSPTDPTSCAAAGGPSAPTCLDTWFARVLDQSGQVVAQ